MSVDYSKPARMRVSEDEVIVSVPNLQVGLIAVIGQVFVLLFGTH